MCPTNPIRWRQYIWIVLSDFASALRSATLFVGAKTILASKVIFHKLIVSMKRVHNIQEPTPV
jgi:hypothetical protein